MLLVLFMLGEVTVAVVWVALLSATGHMLPHFGTIGGSFGNDRASCAGAEGPDLWQGRRGPVAPALDGPEIGGLVLCSSKTRLC